LFLTLSLLVLSLSLETDGMDPLLDAGGYQKNFLAVKQFLEESFPSASVVGGNAPPSPYIEFASHVVTLLQVASIAWFLVGGEKIFVSFLRYPRNNLPRIYYTLQQNAVPLALAIFLLLPPVVSRIGGNAGAFEVFLDPGSRLVYSKLNTGVFPSKEDLVNGLVKAGLQYAK
jgi:selT/selW/selH-like putative selenoprotein